MSLQSGYIGIPGQSIFSSSSASECTLGTKVTSKDGKEYRYILAGENIAAGVLVGTYTEHTNHESLAPTANVAIGDKTLTVTLGNTAVLANEYAGGWLVVTNTPGLGLMYEIENHPAAAGLATCAITLKDPIAIALTTASSKIDLVHNPYKNCLTWVAGQGTFTGVPVGVSTYAIASSEYGWVCVRGAASCLNDGGLTVGQDIVAAYGLVSGAVAPVAAGTTEPYAPVGYALTTGTDTEYPAIFVTIG